MDAFEQIVAMILERNGYWTQTSYKVCLTKDEKKKIEIPSSPRWEIDIIAYSPKDNELLVIECKSFLNSKGVGYTAFRGDKGPKYYKLFTNVKLRRVVFSRLKKQLCKEGRILPKAKMTLCLAAGHIQRGDEDKIKQRCDNRGWKLFAKDWFKGKFTELAETKYENDIAIVAAKLAKIAMQD